MIVGRCFYCERGMCKPRGARDHRPNDRTRDHVIPKSHSGFRDALHDTMTLWACSRCNGARGDAPAVLFYLFAVAELRGNARENSGQVARRFRSWIIRHVTAPEGLAA